MLNWGEPRLNAGAHPILMPNGKSYTMTNNKPAKFIIHNSKFIIILIYLLMVAIVPPQHEYPINDDWIYAQSARNLLHGVFVIPGWSQASQLTHALWGAGFAALFGFSFTALTWSTIVLAAIGSLTFYALLRRLDVGAGAALLGALLLACNPILSHLNYSFMTETSFLTYTLLACYCYLRGLQDGRERWLWLGGAMTAAALLDRQFGVMVALAALLYLLLKGRLTWRRAFAVVLLPALALAGLLLWQAGQPPAEISVQTSAHVQEFFHNPLGVAWEHLSRALIIMPVLGLFAPLALRWRSRIFAAYAAMLTATIIGWYVYSGTVSFDYSRSNIFDSGGFMPPVLHFFRVTMAGPLWLWLFLSLVAALLTAGLLTAATEATIEWWQNPSPQGGSADPSPFGGGWVGERAKALEPVNFVYLAGLLVGLPSLLLTTNFMDRYLVPLIPFVILVALRRPQFKNTIYPTLAIRRQGAIYRAPTIRLIFYLSAIIFYLAFSLIAQRDYFAYAQARWDAGQWVISQGVKY
ncbi:MAG: hypothetical protein DLM69_09285, partial [Candidatus Chloroheliales bacterium]